MTLTDLLLFILQRLDLNSEEALVVTADETHDWPDDGLDFLTRWNLLTPMKPRTHLLCDGCEEACPMPVELIPKSSKKEERASIACDKREDIDIVPVELERLRQWKIDPNQWAALLARLLGTNQTPQMVIQARLWRLGRIELAGLRRNVFFGYGMDRSDEGLKENLKVHISHIGSLLLVPWHKPSVNSHDQPATIMPLSEALLIDNSRLSIDIERIEATVSLVSQGYLSETTRRAEPDFSNIFKHSADYSSVWLHGEQFRLTPIQRQVIQALHEAFSNGTPELSGHFILEEIGCSGKRLRDLFKVSKAWGALIVQSEKRGTYRLNI